MNRRSFIDTLLRGAAAFSILPSATTYARTWKKTDAGVWACVIEPRNDGADMFTVEGATREVIRWRNAYADRMTDYLRSRGINLVYVRDRNGKFQLVP